MQDLYNAIYKRKSFHQFRNVGNAAFTGAELAGIVEAWRAFAPLDPDIRTDIRVVPTERSACHRGQEYCVLLFSEPKDGYLRNIGYLGEQLDLYLVSQDIGTLWYGIGRPKETPPAGMVYVIMIAIRKVEDAAAFRKDMFKSKRLPLDEILAGEKLPGVSEIVRFTPSACNSQPWRVRWERKATAGEAAARDSSARGASLTVYRHRKPGRVGIMPAKLVPYYNRIDMGIFLCFLDLCLAHEGIRYERELCADAGGDEEMTVNARYKVLGKEEAAEQLLKS
ncbi:MAG: nitroreductase [Firmicutes bacterium]|nr:nitroreductase [Bacillota bacterium]